MATPGYFDRVPAVGNKSVAVNSSLPHTPTRQISSPLASPLVGHRVDEESVIFEIGARHFSAGFTGESSPRCRLSFGPEASRRVGDYRMWLPGYKQKPRIRRTLDSWSVDHELWQMDMRDVDLALVGDKIERAVREAYNQYLLLDYKSTKKLIVVLPSALPHPLLNTLLWSLFQMSPSPPTITLFPCDALVAVAAGCRSALVVDIGWRESTVTAVYEYRQIKQLRSTRAMRAVAVETARLLQRPSESQDGGNMDAIDLDLTEVEDLLSQCGWCTSTAKQDVEAAQAEAPSASHGFDEAQIPFERLAAPAETLFFENPHLDDQEHPLHILAYQCLLSMSPDIRAVCVSRIIITGGGSNLPGLKTRILQMIAGTIKERGWSLVSPSKVSIGARKNAQLSKPGDSTMTNLDEVLQGDEGRANDTNKLSDMASKPGPVKQEPDGPLGSYVKDSIEVTENAMHLSKVIDNAETERDKRSQDVRGAGSNVDQASVKQEQTQRKETDDAPYPAKRSIPVSGIAAHVAPQQGSEWEGTNGLKENPARHVTGTVRGVETLGAWAGASLLANLKVHGVVEIDRDIFLQSRLAGARKDKTETTKQPIKAGEKSSWTLGPFS